MDFSSNQVAQQLILFSEDLNLIEITNLLKLLKKIKKNEIQIMNWNWLKNSKILIYILHQQRNILVMNWRKDWVGLSPAQIIEGKKLETCRIWIPLHINRLREATR